CRRHIEEDDRQQPEDDMRWPQLRCRADPTEADDEENLGEYQIGQAKFFFEDGAVRFDALLGAAKFLCRSQVIFIGHRGYLSLSDTFESRFSTAGGGN